ncbi:hypothetical protein TSAR_011014, partial [Trichomalopsis sarcophagae]
MCDNSINIASCGLSEISASEQRQITNLIDALLPRDGRNNKVLKTTDLIEHEIKLLHSARPVKQRYHPVSEKMQKAICGLSEISASEQRQINNLIDQLLPRDGRNNKVLKTTDLVEHEIELLHSARPVKQRYHPVSEKMQKAMCEQLDNLIEAEIVEKSHSAWNNTIVMVKKRDNSYRMC